MRIKEGVPETAAALRERFGRERLSPKEVMQVTGYGKNKVTRDIHGWIGRGSGQRIAIEVLARHLVG